eukprot:3397904-Pleurochrysis_carterae.AAC.1
MLQRCAATTFGDSALSGDALPTTKNHATVSKWFQLVYACRVMDGLNVSSIDLRVEGHRVCQGAFAAVYSIPHATMGKIMQNVRAGDREW